MLDKLITGGRWLLPEERGTVGRGNTGGEDRGGGGSGASLSPEGATVIDAAGKDCCSRGHRDPRPRGGQRAAGSSAAGSGDAKRRAPGPLAGGHLGRDDDGDGLCAGAQSGGPGGGHPRLHLGLAGQRLHRLLDPLHLFQRQHARRHFAVQRANQRGVSQHQGLHHGHPAAGGPGPQPDAHRQDRHGEASRRDDPDLPSRRSSGGAWRRRRAGDVQLPAGPAAGSLGLVQRPRDSLQAGGGPGLPARHPPGPAQRDGGLFRPRDGQGRAGRNLGGAGGRLSRFTGRC